MKVAKQITGWDLPGGYLFKLPLPVTCYRFEVTDRPVDLMYWQTDAFLSALPYHDVVDRTVLLRDVARLILHLTQQEMNDLILHGVMEIHYGLRNGVPKIGLNNAADPCVLPYQLRFPHKSSEAIPASGNRYSVRGPGDDPGRPSAPSILGCNRTAELRKMAAELRRRKAHPEEHWLR